jgi:hypothetical protein
MYMTIYAATGNGLIPIDVLNELKKKAYKLEFRREASCIYCDELQQWILPADFNVDEWYYVGETTMPDADRMVYAISLLDGPKGFLIDACNAYMDNISPEMLAKLKPEQLQIIAK